MVQTNTGGWRAPRSSERFFRPGGTPTVSAPSPEPPDPSAEPPNVAAASCRFSQHHAGYTVQFSRAHAAHKCQVQGGVGVGEMDSGGSTAGQNEGYTAGRRPALAQRPHSAQQVAGPYACSYLTDVTWCSSRSSTCGRCGAQGQRRAWAGVRRRMPLRAGGRERAAEQRARGRVAAPARAAALPDVLPFAPSLPP